MSEKPPLRVLFLDIDGVLNSHRSCIALGGMPHDFSEADMRLFDPLALSMLQALCDVGYLSVVVSSSWRILFDFDVIGRGLSLPVIGATPRLAGIRGAEVAAWLAASPMPVAAYAIVDDDSDFLPDQLPRFVQTQHAEGLSYANFEALCALFGVNPYDCYPRARARIAEERGG